MFDRNNRFTLMLAASLGRSANIPAVLEGIPEDALCDFIANLADAFTDAMTRNGRYIGDLIARYDAERGGILLYDATDALWEITQNSAAVPTVGDIATVAFRRLFPDTERGV